MSKSDVVISERSLLCDALFWTVDSKHYGASKQQKASYNIVWHQLVSSVSNVVPDAFIYMRVPFNECNKRQFFRHRAEEMNSPILQRMKELNLIHEKYYGRDGGVIKFEGGDPKYLKPFAGKQLVVINNPDPESVEREIERLTEDSGTKHIAIVGNIASGKSTVLNHLNVSGYSVKQEPIKEWEFDNWNVLGGFYENPEFNMLSFQMVVCVTRAFAQPLGPPKHIVSIIMSKSEWKLVDVVAGENVVPLEDQCVLKRAIYVNEKHSFEVNYHMGDTKMPVTCTNFEKVNAKDKYFLGGEEFTVDFEPNFRITK